MPYTATFDHRDNLYVGDINRGRVLVYRNPFDNPPRPKTSTTTEAVPPSPDYTATIHSADPEPPQCVIPTSPRPAETTLRLEVDGISEIRDTGFMIQFRRVTGAHRERLYPDGNAVQVDATHISIDMSAVSAGHWLSRGKAVLTLQIMDNEEAPISNWSPAFILAGDQANCEAESPFYGYTPSDTQLNDFTPCQPRPSLLEDYLQRTQSPNSAPPDR